MQSLRVCVCVECLWVLGMRFKSRLGVLKWCWIDDANRHILLALLFSKQRIRKPPSDPPRQLAHNDLSLIPGHRKMDLSLHECSMSSGSNCSHVALTLWWRHVSGEISTPLPATHFKTNLHGMGQTWNHFLRSNWNCELHIKIPS